MKIRRIKTPNFKSKQKKKANAKQQQQHEQQINELKRINSKMQKKKKFTHIFRAVRLSWEKEKSDKSKSE